MATDRPRYTVSVDNELFQQIEDFRRFIDDMSGSGFDKLFPIPKSPRDAHRANP